MNKDKKKATNFELKKQIDQMGFHLQNAQRIFGVITDQEEKAVLRDALISIRDSDLLDTEMQRKADKALEFHDRLQAVPLIVDVVSSLSVIQHESKTIEDYKEKIQRLLTALVPIEGNAEGKPEDDETEE